MRKIGIMGAMREEIAPFLEHYGEHEKIEIGANSYYKILLEDAELYLAYSKIGKVHSSITASVMILKFGCDTIIFSGVAGGLTKGLKVGDIVVATELCQHDVDITAFGHPVGFIPESKVHVKSDLELNDFARVAAKKMNIDIKEGIIASGDQFIFDEKRKGWIVENFGAHAVEMEGASVGVVCEAFGIPFCIIRSISDSADDEASVSFDKFMETSAKKTAQLAIRMVGEILHR